MHEKQQTGTDQLGRILGAVAGLGLLALAIRRRITGWRCLAVAAAGGSAAAALLLAQVAAGALSYGAAVAMMVPRARWAQLRGLIQAGTGSTAPEPAA